MTGVGRYQREPYCCVCVCALQNECNKSPLEFFWLIITVKNYAEICLSCHVIWTIRRDNIPIDEGRTENSGRSRETRTETKGFARIRPHTANEMQKRHDVVWRRLTYHLHLSTLNTGPREVLWPRSFGLTIVDYFRIESVLYKRKRNIGITKSWFG